ncbi:serine/threonine-protein kinase [Actinomadura sp. HBU206391]|uniref:serine/threonine-protein kinase n=1 Tax=Actinomadura sp. HBU206391 TaxID=2731692 RepID=UPI00164F58EE|nr:serine/threonine-protein kinase [Actinomadura sp. HBU206391]MBC6458096.1 serine/threonine-protein kinase [Actinomadura sp. HBU206391]
MEALRPGDPEKIGGYECVGRLGAGGMGEVFLARAEDGGLVALKLIHADLAEDAAFRARFAREAAAVRRVSGPYTAPLLDTGDVPRPWLATAYLPGLSLDQAVTRHGPLSVEATRRLGAVLAEALGAIHRAGVVHRDLKPANILLTADGPRVVDFGIAGGPDIGTGDGTAGRPVGTPAYMAPEQITGGPVTPAADVFALGGVLMFCRTGSPPFGTVRLPEPLDRVVRARPYDTDDAGLREVVAACLAENPVRRPSTDQLTTVLPPGATGTGWLPAPMAHDIADQADSIPPSTQAGPRLRRRVLLRISGVGAAALAGMGVVRALGGAEPPAASVLWAARATAVTGYELGPALHGRLFLLDRTVVTRSGGARLDLCCLDTATGRYRWRRPLTPFDRERGEVVAGPGGVWVRSTRELHAIDPDSGTVRWSQQRAFPGLVPAAAYGVGVVYDVGPALDSDDAGTVYAHEPRTGRVVWERRVDGRPVGPLVIARGVLYVISASARGRWERVHALDAATGGVRWMSGFADEDVVMAPPFAPNYTDATLSVADDTVYVSVEGRHVHALDARTGSARWRVRPQLNIEPVLGRPYPSAAFPVTAGNTLFLGTGDGVLRAFDIRHGRQRWAVETGAPPAPVGVFRRRFTPVVGHGLVFVRGADSVRALRVGDGGVRWERRTDPSAGEPVLAGGTLHVPGKWEVTSHDPVSGRVVQRLDLRDYHRSPTAVLAGEGALYVLAGVDAVVAVGLPG